MGAGSTGQRNTSVKTFCWSFKLQRLAWALIVGLLLLFFIGAIIIALESPEAKIAREQGQADAIPEYSVLTEWKPSDEANGYGADVLIDDGID